MSKSKRGNIAVIILAAGRGSRMHSKLPKVLHSICGKPMLSYILNTLRSIKGIKKKLIVIGYKHELVKEYLKDIKDVKCIRQRALLGTADAVRICKSLIPASIKHVLVVYGDSPFLTKSTLDELLNAHIKNNAGVTLLTARLKDPTGYGRIIRDNLSNIKKIAEDKEAGYVEKTINEINVGATCFNRNALFNNLTKIKADNNRQEYYLTSLIEIFANSGIRIESFETNDVFQVQGIDSQDELQAAYAIMRQRIIQENMNKGVEIIDPQTTFINSTASIGENSIIYPFTVIEDDVKIGKDCRIGPFCHLRPGAMIDDGAEVGNFIEVVRSQIGKNTKVKHFGYLGDIVVGKDVNIGAGVVAANYNGETKNVSKVADKAFVGSDTVLVAPVKIGKSAVTGAGSVVVKDTIVSDKSIVVGVPAKPIIKGKSSKNKRTGYG